MDAQFWQSAVARLDTSFDTHTVGASQFASEILLIYLCNLLYLQICLWSTSHLIRCNVWTLVGTNSWPANHRAAASEFSSRWSSSMTDVFQHVVFIWDKKMQFILRRVVQRKPYWSMYVCVLREAPRTFSVGCAAALKMSLSECKCKPTKQNYTKRLNQCNSQMSKKPVNSYWGGQSVKSQQVWKWDSL